MTEFLTHDLLDMPGFQHGFFTRRGGVSEGPYASLNAGAGSDDNPDHVRINRERVASAMGTPAENLLSLWQHHSTDVLIVDGSFDGERPKADGLVTQTPGLAISALAADCGPVLLADSKTRTIGACHAGWRGALSGITDATIKAMEALGAKRENICAVLGPCIGPAAYEVGHEFRDTFVAEKETYDRFFKLGPVNDEGERRPYFDLKRFILARLRNAGLSRIDCLENCTYSEPELFFSYRYNTHQKIIDYGRNISAIMLTE